MQPPCLHFAMIAVRSRERTSVARKKGVKNVRIAVCLRTHQDVASSPRMRPGLWLSAQSVERSRDRTNAARKRGAINVRTAACLRVRPGAANFPRPRRSN
tara:strand:+ start:283 stop:582 length:300 start_codon:yes stop_codon:yes gene_type:complete